ncbi:hypothetical protein T459_34617 [Capsicum annuum]|uniref:Uncharacterized protein n=1 Tax=Capsicum annuum TaxID=4072 RepID=A0A2G2XW45_CAPAN|nr:hypothetical protein T459_34617 [Capsicum annuum]
MNSLSVWAWMFLFGHLVGATGFMFLISCRRYWQELIETLAWALERTPLANLIRQIDKPMALSIVQAKLVGFHLCDFLDCLYVGQIWLINVCICDNLISFDGDSNWWDEDLQSFGLPIPIGTSNMRIFSPR